MTDLKIWVMYLYENLNYTQHIIYLCYCSYYTILPILYIWIFFPFRSYNDAWVCEKYSFFTKKKKTEITFNWIYYTYNLSFGNNFLHGIYKMYIFITWSSVPLRILFLSTHTCTELNWTHIRYTYRHYIH